MAGLSLYNSQCSSPTLYTHTVYIELHDRRQAGSEGQGRSAGEYKVGGTEGAMGGREGGSDDVRQGRGEGEQKVGGTEGGKDGGERGEGGEGAR